MAIVISEIEIAVTVVSDGTTGEQRPTIGTSKEEIIKECVEIVMDILKEKNER